MKKAILITLIFALIFTLNAWAADGVTSRIETNRMVYSPGETVYAVIYVENNTAEDVTRNINIGHAQPKVSLHSDAELSGGGEYHRVIMDLPLREIMGIGPTKTRPYAAFTFELVDENGAPLPKGYYAITHGYIGFSNMKPDEFEKDYEVGDSAHVIFVSEDSLKNDLSIIKQQNKKIYDGLVYATKNTWARLKKIFDAITK